MDVTSFGCIAAAKRTPYLPALFGWRGRRKGPAWLLPLWDGDRPRRRAFRPEWLKRELKQGAAAPAIRNLDASFVGGNGARDDRHAKARASAPVPASLPEALEDGFALGFGNARSAIGDHEDRRAHHTNVHGSAAWCVLDAVLNKIAKRPKQVILGSVDESGPLGLVDLDGFSAGNGVGSEVGGDIGGKRVEIDLVGRHDSEARRCGRYRAIG